MSDTLWFWFCNNELEPYSLKVLNFFIFLYFLTLWIIRNGVKRGEKTPHNFWNMQKSSDFRAQPQSLSNRNWAEIFCHGQCWWPVIPPVVVWGSMGAHGCQYIYFPKAFRCRASLIYWLYRYWCTQSHVFHIPPSSGCWVPLPRSFTNCPNSPCQVTPALLVLQNW